MAFAVCDCLMAGAENCYLLPLSECNERMLFYAIKKKSEITLALNFAF